MRRILWLIAGLALLGCKKDSPQPPSVAKLLFPDRNSECTTGVPLGNTNSSRVEFRWQAAANTETYELSVTNLNTNVSQNISTSATSASLPLEAGAPFSWRVISRNSQTPQPGISESWLFYNAGSQTSYAPFPAEIIMPKSGASVFRDISNEVTLNWAGADVDNDIVGYEVYFDTVSPPQVLLASLGAGTNSIKVGVLVDTLYYWKVVTIDSEGNRADSGVYAFKAF